MFNLYTYFFAGLFKNKYWPTGFFKSSFWPTGFYWPGLAWLALISNLLAWPGR
jgi:hypothetical protein